jgi:N-acetylglucosamine-6-phosphate deacetylase
MTTILSGARVVTPDRVISEGAVVIEDGRITDVREGRIASSGADWHDLSGHVVVPGFIDVHVHGVEGIDTLTTTDAVRQLASRLPRYGVTGFCPTTVACGPVELRTLLDGIRDARTSPAPGHAAVLPAHLESNFINPDFRGAQPLVCLRRPTAERLPGPDGVAAFSGEDVLEEIDRARREVGILTIAPELDGGLDLVRRLSRAGHLVSLGHSGATFEQGLEGVDAGARHATHLFNRMPPFSHRAPGLVGAVLQSEPVCAEIVCDGYHVHPAVLRTAVARLGPRRTMAITDGTGGSGLPVGTRVRLGSHTITVKPEAAFLADGTLAGSTLTMEGAFRNLVTLVGVPELEAAHLCATTPARQLGLADRGRIEPGYRADIAVLGPELRVAITFVNGVRWQP